MTRSLTRFLCVLFIGIAQPALAERSRQPCPPSLLLQLQRQFGETGELRSQACKTLPNNAEHMVVSYIAEASETHPSDTSRLRHWRVVLMEQQRRHILASYEEVIDEDAGRTISESTVWIDTAPYMLTPTQRAFAIRLDIETSPSCGDGGLSDYMTLFVTEGHALKPVIHLLPTRFWYFRSPNPCLYPSISPVTERAQSTFQLLPSQHHGYFDIRMISTAHTTADSADGSEALLSQRRFSNTFVYNGKEYDIPGWELLPSPQWWPE